MLDEIETQSKCINWVVFSMLTSFLGVVYHLFISKGGAVVVCSIYVAGALNVHVYTNKV